VVGEVPEAYQRAAEEVRAHLVALRGGAPFLSPDDARLLVDWLDQGISVALILRALERAAESRRKRRSRIPLSLRHAKRHLGKATRGRLTAVDLAALVQDHPLTPLVDALRAASREDSRAEAVISLAAGLHALPADDAETLLRGALAEVRRFFTHAWETLDEVDRGRRLEQAREAYADAEGIDEATLLAAIEEHARDGLRRDYPLLTAATLWDLVHR
jgi:hypothetical protein